MSGHRLPLPEPGCPRSSLSPPSIGGYSAGVVEQPSVYIVLTIPTRLPESRWVYDPPRRGSTIEDRSGTKWRVAEVLQSGRNVYTVHCEPTRRSDVRSLATDLLDRARKAASPTERRRRHYLP